MSRTFGNGTLYGIAVGEGFEVFFDCEREEAFAGGSQLESLGVGLVAGSLEKNAFGIGHPVPVTEGMVSVVEAAVAAVVVHALEEGRAVTDLEAVADEDFGEFFEVVLNLLRGVPRTWRTRGGFPADGSSQNP